ncbi:MAG: MaoC family dehydratase N-terminal domain-containing protein [Propionibacteriaceae bacterium]|nr:MaoC family dehydratase N-terminal domain-containing protein [Propionibacteriaceae bacterium]
MTEFDWLDAITAGDTFGSETPIEVTSEEIIEFARTYDPQPGHLDEATARETAFEGLSASGWLTAALTMKLLCDAGFTDTIGLGVTLEWPTATRPGDILHLQGRITSKRRSQSRPGVGILGIEYETLNQLGEVRQRTQATLRATESFHARLSPPS